MRVLVACEYSGVVRRAFRALGHEAVSCDLLPADDRSISHVQGDVLHILDHGWDLMIAHPPCTHLSVSGARWFKDKIKEQAEALEFVRALMAAPRPVRSVRWHEANVIARAVKFADVFVTSVGFGAPLARAGGLLNDAVEGLQAARKTPKQPPVSSGSAE